MVNVEYANAYSEVLEILKFISKEDYEKIPASKIELFKLNSNKEYKFTYNPEKTLDEQNVSKRAKAIIGILFRDYWATEIQREKIIKKQENDRLILEEQKSHYMILKIYLKNKIFVVKQKQKKLLKWQSIKQILLQEFLIKLKNF